MNKLEQARVQINAIDQQIAELFEQRMEAVEDVVSYKIENNMQVLDQSRENILIEKNVQYIQKEKYKASYYDFLQNVLRVSREYQKTLISKNKVAYGGVEGAFSHIASCDLFPHNVKIAYKTFEEVIHAVEEGVVQYGVIPFENSSTGEVSETSELLRDAQVYIHGTYDLKITQNLLGVKGTHVEQIQKVYSHPQGLSQCKQFFQGRTMQQVPYVNTALAAKYVSESKDPSIAAIASLATAKLYNLDVLVKDINTNKDNTTRFIIICKEQSTQGTHFQMLFSTKDEKGTLAKAINMIAEAGFNLSSLKSKAVPNEPWKYYFHIEVEGNLASDEAKRMLDALASYCLDMKILGAYTKKEGPYEEIY